MIFAFLMGVLGGVLRRWLVVSLLSGLINALFVVWPLLFSLVPFGFLFSAVWRQDFQGLEIQGFVAFFEAFIISGIVAFAIESILTQKGRLKR